MGWTCCEGFLDIVGKHQTKKFEGPVLLCERGHRRGGTKVLLVFSVSALRWRQSCDAARR